MNPSSGSATGETHSHPPKILHRQFIAAGLGAIALAEMRETSQLLAAPSSSQHWLYWEKVHLTRVMMSPLGNAVIFQRRHLLETQQEASAQVIEMEERWCKLPPQLQGRITVDERRITGLEKEPDGRSDENRELLRAKIVLVKRNWEAEISQNRLHWN